MDPRFARQYYESAAAEHWWFHGRRRLVSAMLENHGVSTGVFVDLGAGAESLFPQTMDVVKLDLVRPESVPGLFVQASAEQLPFPDSSFDGLGLFDVLEHLSDPNRCLLEAQRVVRPGGLVIVTVPAYRWLWSPHDDLVGHHRRYTLGELRTSLSGAGLVLLWSSAFYGFLLPPAAIRAVFSMQSSMSMPSALINRSLALLAEWSIRRVIRRPTRIGLSIGAVAKVK